MCAQCNWLLFIDDKIPFIGLMQIPKSILLCLCLMYLHSQYIYPLSFCIVLIAICLLAYLQFSFSRSQTRCGLASHFVYDHQLGKILFSLDDIVRVMMNCYFAVLFGQQTIPIYALQNLAMTKLIETLRSYNHGYELVCGYAL